MLRVLITSNLDQAKRSWVDAGIKFRRACKTFLPNRQRRILRHVQEIIQATVYDVYTPEYYERTYNLKKSMTVSQYSGNPYKLIIWSNPSTAKAIAAPGGYAKFVAGEGPGIGFLKPFYGPADDRRPSHFPRRFPEAIVKQASSIYNNIEADLNREFVNIANKLLI